MRQPPLQPASIRFLRYWLPLIVWMGLIFIASTDLMSAEQTSRIIRPLLRWFKPDISAQAIAQVQFFTRKAAHLTEYAVLAALLWRAVRLGTTWRLKVSILFIAVWLSCGMFAASDEFHQSFVASRTASSGDVLLDICGAFVGLAICATLVRRRDIKL